MKKILLSMLSLAFVFSVSAQCDPAVQAYLDATQEFYGDDTPTNFYNFENFGNPPVARDTSVCNEMYMEVAVNRFVIANVVVTDAGGAVLVDSLFYGRLTDAFGFSGPFPGGMMSAPVKQYDADMEGCAGVAYPMNFFAGHIALVARGSCAFAEKSMEAEAAGAVGIIIHNATLGGGGDDPDDLLGMIGDDISNIPSLGTSFNNGIFIQDDLDVGNTVTITLNDEPVGTWEWYTSDGTTLTPIAGATTSSYIATADGTYGCAIGTADGCAFPVFSNYQANVTIDPNLCVGINTPELNASITAFPNPSTGMISLDLTDLNEVANVSVMNVAGEQVVAPARYNNELVSIDLNSLSNGVYFVQIVSEGASTTRKITILK